MAREASAARVCAGEALWPQYFRICNDERNARTTSFPKKTSQRQRIPSELELARRKHKRLHARLQATMQSIDDAHFDVLDLRAHMALCARRYEAGMSRPEGKPGNGVSVTAQPDLLSLVAAKKVKLRLCICSLLLGVLPPSECARRHAMQRMRLVCMCMDACKPMPGDVRNRKEMHACKVSKARLIDFLTLAIEGLYVAFCPEPNAPHCFAS